MSKIEKYHPLSAIESPCSDISYEYKSLDGKKLIVTMHFSQVSNNNSTDLVLTFTNVLMISYEDESYPMLNFPKTTPLIESKEWASWYYPLLIWSDSKILKQYIEHGINSPKHFLLLSMNDILTVITESNPNYKWINT